MTCRDGARVRAARPADAVALHALMRRLAAFEGYLDAFSVTPQDLLERGLGDPLGAQFHAFVAEVNEHELCGYAVVQELAFSFDLRPTLILKELFVEAAQRGGGAGGALFEAVCQHGRARGCGRIRWTVLPDNLRAQAFYDRQGGRPDIGWQPWILPLDHVI